MNLSTWRKPLSKNPFVTSPTQFIIVSVPLVMIVLAILITAFQINRQLYDQQQVIVGRLSQAAVRHTAQLQREHLRLYVLIEATTNVLDEDEFDLQRNLVESRLRILKTTLETSETTQQSYELYHAYVADWEALQPLLTQWQLDPGDQVLKSDIAALLSGAELSINHIAMLTQMSVETRIGSWADKSQFLNQLLTIGSISFAVIIFMMAYTTYLFFKNQAASEQRLRVILETIPDAVYRVNRNGVYTDYKPAADTMNGLPVDATKGKAMKESLSSAMADLVQKGIETVLVTGEQLLLELSLPDEATDETNYYEARLLASGGDEVQIITRNITSSKKQDEAVLQAQKLESLGVLAGGIAHDFNNLLAGMLGQASLAATKLERNLPVNDNIKKIIFSAERAADLTRQLLAYTGRGKIQIGPVDVNQLIRETAGLLETTLPANTELQLKLQDDLPLIEADQSQIQQVIMNLLINAVEAMTTGQGVVHVSTYGRHVEDGSNASRSSHGSRAASGVLEPGHYAAIEVTDNGSGMDQPTLSRIFDPFFSTKPKGHGLGLSATIGIIRTHRGTLQVESEPGVGTTFMILLPVCKNVQPSEEVAVAPEDVAVKQSCQKVLVIDDEEHVLDTATEILEQNGWNVITAATGSDGIEVFRKEHGKIGVVLLDLKMPGMNGRETYEVLQRIQPNTKVIFTSGYTDAEVGEIVLTSEDVSFLPKPYTAQILTAAINSRLVS